MTIKRILEINDKNYNETFELCSKNGYFNHEFLYIFDVSEIAQICIKLTAKYDEKEEICKIDKTKLKDIIIDYQREYIQPFIDEIYGIAIENINDDEELQWG